MADEQEEERRLHSVALRNAQGIPLAREQAVDHLVTEGDRTFVGMVEAGNDAQERGFSAARGA